MSATALRVVPLLTDLGTSAGHRLVLLSLEVWDGWMDLRFARVDVGAQRPLPRRVPPVEAWTVRDDHGDYTVADVVGRGDRALSNGEVRLTPTLRAQARSLTVAVRLTPDGVSLTGEVSLPVQHTAGGR